MAKTKEELKALKNEIETLNGKLKELTDEEMEQVVGGLERLGAETVTLAEIQARLPKVKILDPDGAPGASSSVRVRGISTIRAANEPLKIIE